ncbi:MAG: FAD:protein FMN transferase [Zetaproteobacteria bacterium]|nr:FAD:protein FMN transferase [Zetaproteobacteria bacterium]
MRCYASHFYAMACDCFVQLYAPSQVVADRALDAVMHETQRIEKKYSRFDGDSYLSFINVEAAQHAVRLDDESVALIDYALAAHRMSDGLFDITTGALQLLWDFDGASMPLDAHIQHALNAVSMEGLAWHDGEIEFLRPGMQLDLGGLGKEYAVDRAADLLITMGISHALINFGGDLRALASHVDGSPWQIDITHPTFVDRALGQVALNQGALATSGDYVRRVMHNGKYYSHLLHPHTGRGCGALASVTVQLPHCLAAGTLSTVAMLKGEDGKAWLAGLKVPHWWVDGEGEQGGTLSIDSVFKPLC